MVRMDRRGIAWPAGSLRYDLFQGERARRGRAPGAGSARAIARGQASPLVADATQELPALVARLLALASARRSAVHDPHHAATLVALGDQNLKRIGGGAEDVAHLG